MSLGYEATIPDVPFRETGQSVAPGTIWESRTGATRVIVRQFDSVSVTFSSSRPWATFTTTPGYSDERVTWRIDHFLDAFHQVKDQ